jgi:hypothetical protein
MRRKQMTKRELNIAYDSARMAQRVGVRRLYIDTEVLLTLIDPAWDRPPVELSGPCSSRYQQQGLFEGAEV